MEMARSGLWFSKEPTAIQALFDIVFRKEKSV